MNPLDPCEMTEKQLKEIITELEGILKTDKVTKNDVVRLGTLKGCLAIIQNAKREVMRGDNDDENKKYEPYKIKKCPKWSLF